MEKTILIHSLEEMKQFAKNLTCACFPGSIIGLKGDLGSGKTTFTKYLCHFLGIEGNVNSPTFTILKEYKGPINVYHMDVYRLENIGYDYELDDFIYGDGVAIIEWYPYIENMLPKEILEIEFTICDSESRIAHVKGSGKYEKCVQSLGN